MRTMMKNSFLTKEMQFNCIHSNKGTIQLDDSQESYSYDDEEDEILDTEQ